MIVGAVIAAVAFCAGYLWRAWHVEPLKYWHGYWQGSSDQANGKLEDRR